MDNKIVCKRVASMLSLYINNKVSEHEKIFIETHLSVCESCYNKYVYLKSLIKSLKESYRQIMELSQKRQSQSNFSIREHEKFMQNVSPYIDNELDTQECYEFRKFLTKSKTAQNELKKAYLIQKKLKSSFDKVQKKATTSISRNVMKTIKMTALNDTKFFMHNFRGVKVAQAVVLLGIILFGSYELFNLNNQAKIKHKQGAEINYTKSATNADVNTDFDFVEF